MTATNLKVAFGAMTFGPKGTRSGQVTDLSDQAAMLDAFQSHGHVEIDTARLYNGGHSEKMLAQNNWQKRGFAIATKIYPTRGMVSADFQRAALDFPMYDHSPAGLRSGLGESLDALAAENTGIDVFYLHAPDRNTPYEDTLSEVNKLYEEGKFKRFGLSNYMAWEVKAPYEEDQGAYADLPFRWRKSAKSAFATAGSAQASTRGSTTCSAAELKKNLSPACGTIRSPSMPMRHSPAD